MDTSCEHEKFTIENSDFMQKSVKMNHHLKALIRRKAESHSCVAKNDKLDCMLLRHHMKTDELQTSVSLLAFICLPKNITRS